MGGSGQSVLLGAGGRPPPCLADVCVHPPLLHPQCRSGWCSLGVTVMPACFVPFSGPLPDSHQGPLTPVGLWSG